MGHHISHSPKPKWWPEKKGGPFLSWDQESPERVQRVPGKVPQVSLLEQCLQAIQPSIPGAESGRGGLEGAIVTDCREDFQKMSELKLGVALPRVDQEKLKATERKGESETRNKMILGGNVKRKGVKRREKGKREKVKKEEAGKKEKKEGEGERKEVKKGKEEERKEREEEREAGKEGEGKKVFKWEKRVKRKKRGRKERKKRKGRRSKEMKKRQIKEKREKMKEKTAGQKRNSNHRKTQISNITLVRASSGLKQNENSHRPGRGKCR